MDSLVVIYNIIDDCLILVFIVSLVLFLFRLARLILSSKTKYTKNNFLRFKLIAMAVLFVFLTDEVMCWFVIHRIDSISSAKSFNLSINGADLEDSDKWYIIEAFNNRHGLQKQNGSHPEKLNLLVIKTERDKLELDIWQDSRDKNLYWVYLHNRTLRSTLAYIEINHTVKGLRN